MGVGARRASLPAVRAAVFDAVTAAVRRDTSTAAANRVAGVPGHLLVAAAEGHGVGHLVSDWLRAVDPDHPAVTDLMGANERAARFYLRSLGALGALTTALSDGGVPHLTFKGPILATMAMTTAKRRFSDLDVMVAPADLDRAIELLRGTGAAVFPYGGWRHFAETQHAQIPLTLPFGMPLDLHWHMCSRPRMRRTWPVDPAVDLIARSALLQTPVGPIAVLDRVDMLVHTAGHGGWSGGHRLGWFADIDAVVRAGPIDWDQVVRRTRAWGMDAIVGSMLVGTRHLAGTEVPDEVVAALRGGVVGTVLRGADRMIPIRHRTGRALVTRVLYQEACAGLPGTARALGFRAGEAVTRRLHGQHRDDTAVVPPRGPDDDGWKEPYLRFATGRASSLTAS
jgi:hypothetical protein